MSKSKDLGTIIAETLESLTSVPAAFTFVPSYTAAQGPSIIVSPVSTAVTRTTRDANTEAAVFQAVIVSPVTAYDESVIDALFEVVETIKDNLTGSFISTTNNVYYVTTVTSSGTTALSSLDVEGGLIDSKQLGECCLFQSPVIVELVRYK